MSSVTAEAGVARAHTVVGGLGRWGSLRATADPRAAKARPDVRKFLALGGQLGLLVATFVVFRLEEPTFIVMMFIRPAGLLAKRS